MKFQLVLVLTVALATSAFGQGLLGRRCKLNLLSSVTELLLIFLSISFVF